MKEVFLATAVIGTGLVYYAARNFLYHFVDNKFLGEPQSEKVEEKTLAEVSSTWNRYEDKTLSGTIVDFRDIAKIWRESEQEQTAVRHLQTRRRRDPLAWDSPRNIVETAGR